MKFAVITATYQRANGSTPEVLTRAINSLKNQTHQDFKLFLIGDGYDDNKEFKSFSKLLSKKQIYLENLPFSPERTKYKNPSQELWACGGTSAINRGIDVALEQGFTHITLLDHDDIWYPSHLEWLNKALQVTNSPFIITKGKYTDSHNHTHIIPELHRYDDLEINPNLYHELSEGIKAYPFIPLQCRFMKLSVCMDMSRIPLRFRDSLEETGVIAAGDADMWNRIGELVRGGKLDRGIMVEVETCSNFEEGYSQKNA